MSIIKLLRLIIIFFMSLFFVGYNLLLNLVVIIFNPKTIVHLYNIVKKKPLSRDGKPPPDKWNDPTLGEHGFLQLKEIKLHYVASGDEDKPLMLLIHGLLDCWYTWRYQIREFSKNYRVVAINLRGYSLSDCPREKSSYTLLKNSADVVEVIEALGYKDCILVGYSYGAAIAMIAAYQFPEKISKLVIFNTAVYPAYKKHVFNELADVRFMWPHLYAAVPYSAEFMLSFHDFTSFKYIFLSEYGVRKENLSEEDLEIYKYALSQKGNIYSILYNFRNILTSAKPSKKSTEEIICNTLVIYGTKDQWVKKVMIDDSKPYFPNGVFKTVEGGTHFMHEDQPRLVNELINEFLGQGGNKE